MAEKYDFSSKCYPFFLKIDEYYCISTVEIYNLLWFASDNIFEGRLHESTKEFVYTEKYLLCFLKVHQQIFYCND